MVYYQGNTREGLTNQEKEMLERKFRKVIQQNKTKKWANNYTYFTNENVGIIATDINVSLNLKNLITQLEKQKGIIELNEYDFNTPLNDKNYKTVSKDYETLKVDLEFEFLENTLKNSSHKKIVLLYGEHLKYGVSKVFSNLNLKHTEGKFFPFHYLNAEVK